MSLWDLIPWFFALIGFFMLTGFPLYIAVQRGIDTRSEARERALRLKKARERIMADGKVTGPKGPYVPHKTRWTGATTPSETGPERQAGYTGVHG